MRRRQRWLTGGLAGLGALLFALMVLRAAAPGWIRRKAIASAAARGLRLEVREVKLGFGSVNLEGVAARPEGVDGIEVAVAEARAVWGPRGVGDLITLEGVTVRLTGDESRLSGDVAAWRQRHAGGGGKGGGERRILARGFALRWDRAGTLQAVHASEVEVGGLRVAVRGLGGALVLASASVGLEGGSFEVDRVTGTLVSPTLHALRVRWTPTESLPASPTPLPAPSATPSAALSAKPSGQTPAKPSVAPAPKPPTGPNKLVGATSVVPKPPPPPPPPVAAGSAFWKRLASEKQRLDALLGRLGHGVEFRVEELTIDANTGKLGPWTARAVVGADALLVELKPAAIDGRKPLELRALVPRGAGRWTVELNAGPATLGEIGLTEGSFGLTAVDKSTIVARGAVELDPELESFAASGTLQVAGVAMQHAWLSDLPVTGIAASVAGVLTSKGDFSAWTLTGGRLELGKGRDALEATYERLAALPDGRPGARVRFTWAVPTSSCGEVLESMPKGLLPRLEGLAMTGTLAAKGLVALDARAPERTEVEFGLDQHCRVTSAPTALSMARFGKPFPLRVYDGKGQPKVATFGPGTPSWSAFSKISPYVVDAVLTCEDGAFFSHGGFSAGAIRNAIVANLKAGKFLLGASTVSMQTAKNVFLDRKKQLGRKLEEAVLTIWLEQSLAKNEILELYLNVIEFGPEVYGIGPAAMHWFGRTAADLDAAEAMFLISLLPRPVARHAMWSAGAPDESYLGYVRMLLKEAHRRGKLDDEEFAGASIAPLLFHRPGQPLPAPHGISASKWDTSKAEDPWEPVSAPPD